MLKQGSLEFQALLGSVLFQYAFPSPHTWELTPEMGGAKAHGVCAESQAISATDRGPSGLSVVPVQVPTVVRYPQMLPVRVPLSLTGDRCQPLSPQPGDESRYKADRACRDSRDVWG